MNCAHGYKVAELYFSPDIYLQFLILRSYYSTHRGVTCKEAYGIFVIPRNNKSYLLDTYLSIKTAKHRRNLHKTKY